MAADFRPKVYAYYYPWHSGAGDGKRDVCREHSPTDRPSGGRERFDLDVQE